MIAIKRLFWISLVLKLVVAALLPLTNDEAYYWVWSRHMQLSYYDHPPFVAWLFWLGNFVREWGGSVRWPGVLLGHTTLAIWLVALKPYLNDRQRLVWLAMALLSPLVGGSALVVTPDLPLMFFYAAATGIFLIWAKNPDWRLSLIFGLSMGLGFSSKYMMVLFVLSLLPLTVLSRSIREALLKNLHWIVLGGTLGSTPVWLWNALNDFASIKFQTAHGLGRKFWKPSWTIEYVLAQVGLIFPVVLYWALRARKNLPLVFHLFAWTPLVFFLFTTSRGYVEANWPISAYPALLALAASCYPTNAKGIRFTLALWASLMAALAVVVIAQPTWSKSLKFREFHGYDALIEGARGLEPLYARSYQMAAKMHFELRRPVFKLRGMNRKDFYDYLSESEPTAALFYLAIEKGDALPPSYAARGYKMTERLWGDERYEIWKVERL